VHFSYRTVKCLRSLAGRAAPGASWSRKESAPFPHPEAPLRALAPASLLVLIGLAAGCGEERPRVTGQGCDLTSECEDPLVCRLGRCRKECASRRDCAAGLRCVLDTEGLGACLFPDELDCALNSDCIQPLVCRTGMCTNACESDRDCPGEATCVEEEGAYACEEPVSDFCVYDRACPEPLACGDDQQCRLECVEDRDCTFPRMCVESLCQLPDGGA